MPPRNIFAYTAPGCDMPEFVSVNETNGKIVLTARANEAGGGAQAEVTLPLAELRRLLGALEQEFPSSYADGISDFAEFSREKDGGLAAEAVDTLRSRVEKHQPSPNSRVLLDEVGIPATTAFAR